MTVSPSLVASPFKLDGTWDVHITESSKLGSTAHKATLCIDGEHASYNSQDYFEGARWSDVLIGHTESGKTFVGKQNMLQGPLWMGDSVTVSGRAGLQGRFIGIDSATFTTSVTLIGDRGDEELEITHRGEMRRRTI